MNDTCYNLGDFTRKDGISSNDRLTEWSYGLKVLVWFIFGLMALYFLLLVSHDWILIWYRDIAIDKNWIHDVLMGCLIGIVFVLFGMLCLRWTHFIWFFEI